MPPAGSMAHKFSFNAGDIIQEFGYDDDVDLELRNNIEELIESSLLYEDDQEVVDASLLWWREEDGDLTDTLVDVMATLVEGGHIWLLTPKPGRSGYVDPADIQEAAKTTGLNASAAINVSQDWVATGLASRKKK